MVFKAVEEYIDSIRYGDDENERGRLWYQFLLYLGYNSLAHAQCTCLIDCKKPYKKEELGVQEHVLKQSLVQKVLLVKFETAFAFLREL